MVKINQKTTLHRFNDIVSAKDRLIKDLPEGNFAIYKASGADINKTYEIKTAGSEVPISGDFYVASKWNGELYRSNVFNTDKILNGEYTAYAAGTKAKYSFSMVNKDLRNLSVRLVFSRIKILGDAGNEDEFVFTTRTPTELEQDPSYKDKPMYVNNVFFKEMFKQLNNSKKNNLYDVKLFADITSSSLTSKSSASGLTKGKLYLYTGNSNERSVRIATGSGAWTTLTGRSGEMTVDQVDAFVEAAKSINVDSNANNNGPKLTLEITGNFNAQTSNPDLNAKYVNRRNPDVKVYAIMNDTIPIQVTKSGETKQPVGSGYDLKEIEKTYLKSLKDIISQPLNPYGSGFQPDYKFQIDDKINYNTVYFRATLVGSNPLPRNIYNFDDGIYGVHLAIGSTVSNSDTHLQRIAKTLKLSV